MKTFFNKLNIDNKEFLSIIDELISNKTVQEMKKYRQHYETSCFDHCYMVSYYCYLICKKYKLDYVSATRAGMLHDLFLYDWRVRQPDRKGLHAFTHGMTAYKNASKTFDLNEKEKDMIINHMWPVTVNFPKSFEGFILTFVDKYCAMSETFEVLKTRFFLKKSLRYIYTFASMISIHI